ncbi:charged multivesicular body protein 2a [Reticulomyxa filosa]|uniref:Charged multivesicular body protein 2a n=1 Tax=Reticulomyxa filosa TaxID=46433 RepID=X6N2J9_RETFI|nr:charged multivesicular body protein 2a [Reticulomyxa filosa]|eukprot:ETO20485.1 charged multivesicular body protein 2a [Reticulomyxa filosa]
MRRLAKEGQIQAVRHLAKDIVRMKDNQTKFIKLKAELRSLSAQMDSMAATAQLQKSMRSVSRTMGMVANQIKLPELQASLQKYAMESEKMEMKQDMINEAMDDVMEHDTDDEDELIQKVMDDVGLEWNEKLVDAPAKEKQQEEKEDEVDTDLQARLNNLKR